MQTLELYETKKQISNTIHLTNQRMRKLINTPHRKDVIKLQKICQKLTIVYEEIDNEVVLAS